MVDDSSREGIVNKLARTGPAYRIETRQLVLRCWDPADAPLLQTAIVDSLEHLRPWMPWTAQEPEPLSERVKRLRRFRGRFDLDEDYVYAIFSHDEARVLGGSGLHTRAGENAREIGYWIHVDHVRRGYATEAAAALTRVAFEVDHVLRVEIHCDSRNAASRAVPHKLGYQLEATLPRRGTRSDGSPSDSMIWSLHDVDYTGSRSSKAEIRAYDALGERLL
jgi:RimJ/RimL family protein N-acetyltransferase